MMRTTLPLIREISASSTQMLDKIFLFWHCNWTSESFQFVSLSTKLNRLRLLQKRKGFELVWTWREGRLHKIWSCVVIFGYAHHRIRQGRSPYRPVNPAAAWGQKRVSIGLSAYRDTLCEILAVLSTQREYFSLWSLNGRTQACWWPDASQSTGSDPDVWQDWFGTCRHKPALRSRSSPAWEAFTDWIVVSFIDHRLQRFKYSSEVGWSRTVTALCIRGVPWRRGKQLPIRICLEFLSKNFRKPFKLELKSSISNVHRLRQLTKTTQICYLSAI